MGEQFKGRILIFVYGYGVEEWRCIEHNNPDEYFWSETGWAVGDNPRDRYCARSSRDKIRRFKDFDEAVSYIFRKQKKYPKQRFQLIYELRREWHAVSTLDEVLAIDARLDAEKCARKELQEKELPGLDQLLASARMSMAVQAAQLLKLIREQGEATAKSHYPSSTYYRLVRILKKADLLDPRPSKSIG